MTKFHFACASSLVALLTVVPGLAQAQADTAASVEEVVVTGSRIQVTGFQQPTPVTVVGSSEIQEAMATSVANTSTSSPPSARRPVRPIRAWAPPARASRC